MNTQPIKIKDFTIIIPCILFKDVKECIKQIRQQYKRIKIIVSLNKLRNVKNKDKNLKIIISDHLGIGKKRNIAVDACKTKYVAFIDSDAYPGENWIESTFKQLKKKNVGIVSGPHVDPPNQNYFQMIIGLIKKSFLITIDPASQKKNIKRKTQYVKYLPSANWILSKKIFNLLGQMDGNMRRNEDCDFVYRMSKTKYKLLHSPDTLIYHDNNNIFHFIKKRFKYGFYMWPLLVKFSFLNYYYFLPLFFIIFLISFPLGFYLDFYFIFYFTVLAFYMALILWESVRVSKNLITFFLILPILICANISPGLGILLGFYNYIKNKT